jgi:catechol 2,3-dioxygenase-like lactoylglutathione lyase family enzyme
MRRTADIDPLNQNLVAVTLVVRDYDEAIAYYTQVLDFVLLEDTPMGNDKRWVRVAPRGTTQVALLLARAVDDVQRAAIGRQAGGRVSFFLHTDDFARDHAAMKQRGVKFIGEPRDEAYGRVVVFEDLYGNRWDFIEPAPS